MWRATELRVLYSWFAVTTEGGQFRWKHWGAQLDPTGRLPLEFVSRTWHLALALGLGKDMNDVAKEGLAAHFRPLHVSAMVELPAVPGAAAELQAGSPNTRAIQKEVVDRLVVEREEKKMRARLVVSQWSGGNVRLNEPKPADSEETARLYETRHALEGMDFRQFVRFLRAIELGKAPQRALWSFLLYEEEGVVYPGTLMQLGKAVAPVLLEDPNSAKLEDEGVKIVAAVSSFFGNRVKMSLQEWLEACHGSEQIFTSRLKNAAITSGLGLFPTVTHKVEQLKQHAANFSCQGRLWSGRTQYKVRVENGYLFMVLASKEKEVDGFSESYRLVDTQVNIDPKHRSRFDVALENGEKFRFDAGTEASAKQWVNAILTNVAPSDSCYRFESFAKRRDNVDVKWYVDGKDYFADLLLVLRAAETEILITDWSMSPEIYLERESRDANARLDLTLIAKARAGVKVHIMLWWQSSMATQGTVNANYVVRRFKDIPNISVVLHPSGTFPSKWSHHQKSVIVDRAMGFCGGIDLCYGRYDDRNHDLADECHLSTRFPGKDFYNPGISACDNLHAPWEEKLDRYVHPREPWHDIQMGVNGGCAADLARNFLHRWNHHVKETGLPLAAMAPSSDDGSELPPPKFDFWRKTATEVNTAQILRSLSKWSGNHKTEQSIYKGYLYAIEHAEHFIYVENQFFISSQGPVLNKIAQALFQRVDRAISAKKKFLVTIVLPFHPEGSFDATATRILYKLVFKTIRYLKREMERAHPLSRFGDYFQFGSPIKNAKIGERFFLQLIYVHSKLMIVDDRLVICGSANINDRSMLGDRDSELAIYVEGKLDVASRMGGEEYMVSGFAHSLRVSLWMEHLGLDPKYEHAVRDPCSQTAFEFWTGIAEFNENILKPIVDLTPADLFGIISTGVPAQVKRHRIAAPHFHHGRELRDLLHERDISQDSDSDYSEDADTQAIATGDSTEGNGKGKEEADGVTPPTITSGPVEEESAELTGWLEIQRFDDNVGGKPIMDHFFSELGATRIRMKESKSDALIRREVKLTPSMHVKEWSGAPFGFSVTDDEAARCFAAESDAERHRWMTALRKSLSGVRRRMMRMGGPAPGALAGVFRDGHLLDTAREFLIMDGVVPTEHKEHTSLLLKHDTVSPEDNLASPRVIALEGPTPEESDKSETGRPVDVEGEYRDEEEGEDSQVPAEGHDNNRPPRRARGRKRDEVKEALDKTTDAVHHAVVTVGEGLEHAGHAMRDEASHLKEKAKRFFKAFTHTRVEKRLTRLQGHLVPYPIDYVPRIATDLMYAAPMDIFT